MRKTIVLLLSVAVILGCMAVPVAAANDFIRQYYYSTVSEFHGISMKKLKFAVEYKGQVKITTRLGFKKSGDNNLYGGKTTTKKYNSNQWALAIHYSNLVDSSIGANTPYYELKASRY